MDLNDKTVVTSTPIPLRRDETNPCSSCGVVNAVSNEYCQNCGSPLGIITEIAQLGSVDTPRAAETWRVYGVETAIFGRDEEYEQLKTLFEACIAEQSSRLVVLTGTDGIGKSRLVAELNEQLDNHFDGAHLVAGKSRDGVGPVHAMFSRLIKSRFYISEHEHGEKGRTQLLQGIKAVMRNPLSTEIAHMVGYLIGLPFPDSAVYAPYGNQPQLIIERARGSLASLLAKDAERQPLVLVFEDLHYAGHESMDLIKFLHETLVNAPVMFLCVGLPQMRERAPWMFEEHPRKTVMELKPLSDEDVRRLVDQVLERAGTVSEEIYNVICERAFGVPLSVEEILRVLISSGVIDTRGNEWQIHTDKLPDVDIPASFEGLVQARLDTLTDEETRLLEKASMIGRTFWLDNVASLERIEKDHFESDDSQAWPGYQHDARVRDVLDVLRRKDMIRLREADSSIPGQTEYAFKHEIERKLVYDRIPRAVRQRYHGICAQWLDAATRTTGVQDQFLERIAIHHEVGANLHLAAEFYCRAGRNAAAAYHNQAAVGHFEKALAFLGDNALEQRIETLHDIGSILDLMGEAERSLGYFQQLMRAAWLLGSRTKVAVAYNKMGRAHRSLGRYGKALDELERGLTLFREGGDEAGIAACLDDIGKVHTHRGAYEQAEECYNQALEIRRKLEDPRSEAVTLNRLGTLKLYRGNFKEALLLFRKSLELRKQAGDRRGIAESLNSLAAICHERGDLEQAHALYEEVESHARGIGDRVLLGIALNNKGEVLLMRGDLDDARVALDQAIVITRDTGERRVQFDALRNLGLLHQKLGNYEEAITLIKQAHAIAEDLGARALLGIALRCLGEIYAATLYDPDLRRLNLVKAEECFRQSVEILKEVGNESELGRCLSSYGNYLLEQGLTIQGKKRLEMAKEIFARLEMKRILEKTEQTIEEL